MVDTTGSIPSRLNVHRRREANKPRVVPVGLNFGPTSLSITFFHDDGDYYTGTACGELYKRVFQESLSMKVHCNPEYRPGKDPSTSTVSLITSDENATELMETFSKHIKSAIGEGIWALDDNPALAFKLMAVTVPDHWGQSARTLVATASKHAGHPLDGSYMIISLSRAIQSAFQMSRYSEGIYLTLLLDYNKSYLHLMLVEMCGTDCIMKRQVYLPQFGEDELDKTTVLESAGASEQESLTHDVVKDEPSSDCLGNGDESNSSPSTNDSSTSDLIFPIGNVHTNSFPDDNAPTSDPQPLNEQPHSNYSTTEAHPLDRPTSGNPNDDLTAIPDNLNDQQRIYNKSKAAHLKPIIDTISSFIIHQTTAPRVPNAAEEPVVTRTSTADHLNHAVRNVKYIVIDGEASIKGVWDLRDTIKGAFAQEGWITVEGDRRDCGAYGAALAARRQLQNPKHVGDWKDLPGYLPGRRLRDPI